MRPEQIEQWQDIIALSKDSVKYFEAGKKASSSSKKCPYAPGGECREPGTFEICRNCPFGYAPCLSDIVRNIYKKIVGLTINLLKKDLRLEDLFRKPQ